MSQALIISRRKFIDSLRLTVKGGVGGMGLPKYGGVGGKGGSVYIKAKKDLNLSKILKKYPGNQVKASNGEDSKKGKIYGTFGDNHVIDAPVGVTIYDEWKRKLGELNKEGDEVLLASGGTGGSPFTHPPYSGQKGIVQNITIDLKLIADVGLVGFPNAGKSSLLDLVSAAKPKIAAYAFTTLTPQLGVLEYKDLRRISMADLPGLVEGASYNVGMGHQFLKHIERTKLLLFVVDISGFQLNPICKHRSCLETVLLLNKELELYNEELLDKPAMLIVNKMDLKGAIAHMEEIRPYLHDLQKYADLSSEEIRPNRVIKFEKVLSGSFKFEKTINEKVKKNIREVIEKYFEEEHAEHFREKEQEVSEKALKVLSITGPVVS